MAKNKKEIQRDNSGVTTLTSNVIDVSAIPKRRSKSKPIKIVDYSHNNTLSATRS